MAPRRYAATCNSCCPRMQWPAPPTPSRWVVLSRGLPVTTEATGLEGINSTATNVRMLLVGSFVSLLPHSLTLYSTCTHASGIHSTCDISIGTTGRSCAVQQPGRHKQTDVSRNGASTSCEFALRNGVRISSETPPPGSEGRQGVRSCSFKRDSDCILAAHYMPFLRNTHLRDCRLIRLPFLPKLDGDGDPILHIGCLTSRTM